MNLNKQVLSGVVVFSFLSLAIFASTEKDIAQGEFQSTILKLSELRDLSVAAAKCANKTFQADSKEWEEAKALYTTTKIKGNGIIGLIKLNIMSGTLKSADFSTPTKELKSALHELYEKTPECPKPELTMGLIPLPNIPIAEIISGAIEGLSESLIKAWEAKQDRDDEVKEQIVDFMQTLRWNDWDELFPPEKTD